MQAPPEPHHHYCCLLTSSCWISAQHTGSLHHPAEVPREAEVPWGVVLHLYFLAAKHSCECPAFLHTLFPSYQQQLVTISVMLTQLPTKPLLSQVAEMPHSEGYKKGKELEETGCVEHVRTKLLDFYPVVYMDNRSLVLCVSMPQIRSLEHKGCSTNFSVPSPSVLSLTFLSSLQTWFTLFEARRGSSKTGQQEWNVIWSSVTDEAKTKFWRCVTVHEF